MPRGWADGTSKLLSSILLRRSLIHTTQKLSRGPRSFDHGFWLQAGYFLVPHKLELTGRWSRVVGNSGTLGAARQSADELAGGLAWYINRQHVKLTADLTHLDGAPINSAALDITPGDIGWLFRTQIQFSF